MPSPTATSAIRTVPAANKRRLAWVIWMRRRLSARNAFQGKQLFGGFAAAHQMNRLAVDQHFGGTRPGVVIGAHRHRVCPRRHDGEQVTPARPPLAVFAKEIRALAN